MKDDSGFQHRPRNDNDHAPGFGGAGGAPGKRANTDRLSAADPVARQVRRLREVEALLGAIGAGMIPEMRAALEGRQMQDARRAGAELQVALARVDHALAIARQSASIGGGEAVLAMLAPLEVQRDTFRADPTLALVPPAPPSLPDTAAFDPSAPEWETFDAAEAANQSAWTAQLDAAEAPAPDNVVQLRGAANDSTRVHEHAAAGVAGTGAALPHLDAIQASFGAHDVTGIRAHVGGDAASASSAIGAEAYATGNDVAFAESPSLFVAAHEAAHVVQQRAGVSLLGGVGIPGDTYEQHADAVAEKVVRGESAEGLLGDGGARASNGDVQCQVAPARQEATILEASPSSIYLETEVGKSKDAYVSIWNRGFQPLDVLATTCDADGVVARIRGDRRPSDGTVIDSFNSRELWVTFTPTEGSVTAWSTVRVETTGGSLDIPIQVRSGEASDDRAPSDDGRKPSGSEKPTSPPETASTHDLSPWPSELDVGEQIVNSGRTFTLPWLLNLGSERADVRFDLSGDGFAFDRSSQQFTLFPSSSMDVGYYRANLPSLVYSAPNRGEHAASVTATVRWLDGHVERRTLRVHGRARSLEDAPSDHSNVAPDETETDVETVLSEGDAALKKLIKRAKKVPQPDTETAKSFSDEQRGAERAAEMLATKQRRGVDIVADEASRFERKPAALGRDAWWGLAETALLLGVAGVAAVVAKKLAPRLATAISNALAGANADPAAVENADHIVKLGEFTTEVIKEAVKMKGKAAIHAAGKSSSHATPSGNRGTGRPEHSTNSEIDFFAEQQEILDAAITRNAEIIVEAGDQLWPLLRISPALAVILMHEIAEGLQAAWADAEQTQADRTAQQWCAYVAKAASTSDADDLEDARGRTKNGEASRLSDGLVEIAVDSETGSTSVTGARMMGIDQSLADRLAATPLLEVLVPLRILVGTNVQRPTIITRDVSGRIRADGDFAALARRFSADEEASNEAEAYRGAAALVDEVLSRSLIDWGVQLETDDKTGRK